MLTDPATGEIAPALRPVFDTLIASERPQTTIYWLRRSSAVGPTLLRRMVTGEMEISHAAFERLPSDRAHNYLRDLLVAIRILPAYEPGIARMLPWLDAKLTALPTGDSRIINRFARWRVLRHLRTRAERGELTKANIDRGRQEINHAIHFLAWLRDRNATIDTVGQELLDHYLVDFPPRRYTLCTFVNWLPPRHGLPALVLPVHRQGMPLVKVSDQDRWHGVELLLRDGTIRLYVRVAGLFTLLFAQPLTTICSMRTDQVTFAADRVLVAFDHEPVEMPPVLDDVIREHLSQRGNASYASCENGWLFPGGIPGRPLQTENIRAQLVELGIPPRDSRKAALFQLAATIPAPVLAELIGITPGTAIRWAALTSRSWSAHIAQR